NASGTMQSNPSGTLAEYYMLAQTNSGGGGANINSKPTMHFRHASTTLNAAWMDGHVSGEKMEFTASGAKSGFADYKLGYFGPKTNNQIFKPNDNSSGKIIQ
ncbi:MAG: hypothetical protein JXR78_18150, partial [Victivallales bacterium]|nr:hypothetical protein [Victivallales bacterium]